MSAWIGWVWLAALILVPPLLITLVTLGERAERREQDASYRSRELQKFGEWIAAAPGDGSLDDTLTLRWCPLCRVCTWGSQHWVTCGAWRDQPPVTTVTAHGITRWDEVTP